MPAKPARPGDSMNARLNLTTNSLIGPHPHRYFGQSNRHTTDMQIRYFQFANLRNLFAPRKPRHPVLRIALGLLGVAMLAVLLVVGLFVGAAMILFGITRRLLVRRPTARPDARIVEAEYRVVRERNQAALR